MTVKGLTDKMNMLDHIEQTVAVKQQYVCDQSMYRVS